jgi:hypothetical protein
MIRCKLQAELLEDTHPGSGSGGAGIDALVARDRMEQPVIWASHLEGVLRDAARRLFGPKAAGLYFGRAGGERRRFFFTSLYAETGPKQFRVWRSAARAAFDNRAPQDDTLRAIEFVPKGTMLKGWVELREGDLAPLERLLAEVDAIGHGRATGAGRLRFALVREHPPARNVGKAKTRLRLLLCNADPLSLGATATPTNIIPTLRFIPGRGLLGAIADWLLAGGRQEAASVVVSGAVSVSDALPLPEQPADLAAFDVTPAPLCLRGQKPPGASGNSPWWALRDSPLVRVDVSPKEAGDRSVTRQDEPKLKRPEVDLMVYRPAPKSSWTAYRPEVRVRLRNGRPDPNQADPSLFVVEHIAERTLFAAELRGEPAVMDVLREALLPVLEGRRWLFIGRGGAPIEVADLIWADTDQPVAVNGAAYMTLISDLLARDERLRWINSLDNTVLQHVAKWPGEIKLTPLSQERAPVHGFNGTSRLWRYPAVAVRRGSVFKVEGAGVAKLALAAAEGRWLGERTSEGFGRFRLDSDLPGVTPPPMPPPPTQLRESQISDEDEEAVAATTQKWFKAHFNLAAHGSSSAPRPSLSQWLDLVAELQQDARNALASRMNPDTAGKQPWRDQDAHAVLEKIQVLPTEQRFLHARMFVRWLRAEMRRTES